MAHGHRIAFTLEAGAYGERDLHVLSFRGREALSEPFAFEVGFALASGAAAPMGDLVAKEARLWLRRPDGSERVVSGEIQAVRLVGVAAGRPGYALRLGPRLQRLAHVSRSRIFQGETLLAVVRKVLDEHQVKHAGSPSGPFATREYVVQHQESDLAFVSRLLEEEGIGYRFAHSAGGHELQLFDDVGTGPSLADPIPARSEAEAHEVAGEGDAGEWADRVEEVHGVVTDKVAEGDFDFLRPTRPLLETRGKGSLERYEWPGGFVAAGEGGRRAQVRLEEEGVGAHGWRGRTGCIALSPGSGFEVEGAATLRCLSLTSEGSQTPGGFGGGHAPGLLLASYRNEFVAIAEGERWRPPRRTPRPRVPGVETATVVGHAGEEIEVDRHGRVKVQLHWDRQGSRDDRSSCWIRAAQRWAGSAWGASFIPRVGQEVLVRFLGGDPDRPLLAGAVYDGANPPPIELPANKSQSTLRSSSSPGGDGFNELRLDDAAGNEEVYVHAQRDANALVENDAATEVKGAATLEVAKDRARKVGGDQSLAVKLRDDRHVGGDQRSAVTGDRATTVGLAHDEKVVGSQIESIARTQSVGVGLASLETAGGAAALNVGGGYAVNVAGAMNTAVVGVHAIQVGGASIGVVGVTSETRVVKNAAARTNGSFAATVEGLASVTVDHDLAGEVGGEHEEQHGATFAALAGKLQLEADRITLAVNGKVALTMDRSGNVVLSGATVTLDGSTIATRGKEAPHTAPAPPPSKGPPPGEKPEKSIVPAYGVGEARCGDEIVVRATTTEIPSGQVTFTIRGKPRGGTLGTVKGKLEHSKAEAKWVSKKPKGTKEAELKASASGVSGKASSTLKLKEYADVPPETKVIACSAVVPGGVARWSGMFDAEIKDGVLIITTKIKLMRRLGKKPEWGKPKPPVGSPVSALRKAFMRMDIERRLTNKWVMHRTGCKRGDGCGCSKTARCCKLKVKVKVLFVETGEHHRVDLFQGPGRADCYGWTSVKTRPNSWAHETGHLLGWYDEYPSAGGGANGPAPRWQISAPTHVMNVGAVVPKTYYWDFLDWLSAKEGEGFGAVKP